MRGRASGFYFGVLGLFLTGAGPVAAYFGALYAFDEGFVPAGQTNLALVVAFFVGVLLCIPGLTLMWMADVINEMTALRIELFEQARASQKTAIALDNVSKALEDAFLDPSAPPPTPRSERRPDANRHYDDGHAFDGDRGDARGNYDTQMRRPADMDDRGWDDEGDEFERI